MFRYFKFLSIAVAMVMLGMPVASAATPGDSPADAIPLTGATQSGTLNPGQAVWYQFGDAGQKAPLGVTMNIDNPGIDVGVSSGTPEISFNIWTNTCNSGVCALTQIGTGTLSSQPINVRYWQGSSNVAQTYFVEAFNGAAGSTDYAIAFTDGSYPPPGLTIGAPTTPSAPPAPAPTATPVPAATPTSGGGSSASTATPLVGLQSGILQSGQSAWYSFFSDNMGQQGLVLNFSPASLENPVMTNVVGFTVFQNICTGTSGCALTQVGAGTISGQPFGFKYWTTSASGQTYIIQVFNNAGQSVGYAIQNEGSTFPPGGLPVPQP